MKACVICGPTASGKTEFAHYIARKYDGEIINADSMQVYKEIPIITASPTSKLTDELPYHLYNFLSISEPFSMAQYVSLAAAKVEEIIARGKLPVIVGGTGLYINALLFGYSEIPTISPALRAEVQKLHSSLGQADFFELLKKIDPAAARAIMPEDSQRSIRAYEVFMQTGKSIIAMRDKDNVTPLLNYNFDVVFLNPERKFLYETCNNRLVELFQKGAIDEVSYIHKKFKGIEGSAMKALGLQEILAFLEGRITLDQAIFFAQAKTRQYAKRQVTWFKNQIQNKRTLDFDNLEEFKQILKLY